MQEEEQTNPAPEIEDIFGDNDSDLQVPFHEPDLAPDEDLTDPEEGPVEDPGPDPETETEFGDEDSDLTTSLHEPDLAPDETLTGMEEGLFEEPLE